MRRWRGWTVRFIHWRRTGISWATAWQTSCDGPCRPSGEAGEAPPAGLPVATAGLRDHQGPGSPRRRARVVARAVIDHHHVADERAVRGAESEEALDDRSDVARLVTCRDQAGGVPATARGGQSRELRLPLLFQVAHED